MSSGALVCTGEVSTAVDGAPICSSAWMLVQVPTTFDPSTLDPALVAQCFGAGFIVVAGMFGSFRAVKALLDAIKTF